MLKVAILSANLGGFDTIVPHVEQSVPEGYEFTFHTWTDENFPPIVGYTPRFQYRIPKMFGWEMLPLYDYYLWLDGSVHMIRSDTVAWMLGNMLHAEFAVFKHPDRTTIEQEVQYIEKKLEQKNPYMTSRYENGLHRQNLEEIWADKDYYDNALYASTVFMYSNITRVRAMLKSWWFYQARYWSCDQIPLPYVLWKHEISTKLIDLNVFDNEYINLGKKHT